MNRTVSVGVSGISAQRCAVGASHAQCWRSAEDKETRCAKCNSRLEKRRGSSASLKVVRFFVQVLEVRRKRQLESRHSRSGRSLIEINEALSSRLIDSKASNNADKVIIMSI